MIDPNGPAAALANSDIGCPWDNSERRHRNGDVWTYRIRFLATGSLIPIGWLIEHGWGVKVAPLKAHVLIKIWKERH
jgi:hypothetical protein